MSDDVETTIMIMNWHALTAKINRLKIKKLEKQLELNQLVNSFYRNSFARVILL